MNRLNLKPSHKPVENYYAQLRKLRELGHDKEGAVAPAFAELLRRCGGQFDLTLVEQHEMRRKNGRRIVLDGALLDDFNLAHGYWEAKDTDDDLATEVQRKFEKGYPRDNILFQAPDHAILIQDGQTVFDGSIDDPDALIRCLAAFFEYRPPEFVEWSEAVEEFKERVPELARGVLELIEQERQSNKGFKKAFQDFEALCREAINPNLSTKAVEEMLIQHLLTERIFRRVFDNPDFTNRNIIAREIEKVIDALTSKHFSRQDFLKSLDRFYIAIETTAASIDDYSRKQAFLNTVYENFFQGYSIKVADTHGIVYTPQPIVDFMVRSVEEILKNEFDRSLADDGVHVLDPFVGTGNFVTRVMREIKRTQLPHKYRDELHCNEVMLLPYYIAAMNIEHAYYEATGEYEPFEGICLVDTFELAEEKEPSFFSAENTQRVKDQQKAPIFVVIGNPPYNAWQVNENDNNRNRKYRVLDKRVASTYSKDSQATNKNALSDVYVKAYRWASDRIGDEGIVAFVSNNSFINQVAFDGMRQHLAQDFDAIYVLDLGGNVRQNPKLSGTTHNVFGIQVGVSINLLVKTGESNDRAKIYYARTDEYWRNTEKFDFLEEAEAYQGTDWQELTPDSKHTWLTEGLEKDFDSLIPLGMKKSSGDGEQIIFNDFSNGLKTNRDTWVWNWNEEELRRNIQSLIETYNEQVFKWKNSANRRPPEQVLLDDPSQISWSEGLKNCLRRKITLEFQDDRIRFAIYRPFTRRFLYFDQHLNERRYQLHHIFPNSAIDNRLIWLKVGSAWPMFSLMLDSIPDLLPQGGSQCFPFYTYDEDGSNRQENITDWALEEFREHYADDSIDKWAIFHYVYGLLHHPGYRTKYEANLKRELPRIPFAPDFWAFANAGKRLAELHVNYEDQDEYPLTELEDDDADFTYHVEKMKLSKDKTQLIYNDFLTLAGIPEKVFQYRLGNRSALEWIVDQYRVKTDKRSGIVHDPNDPDDPDYIVRLVKKIVTVSLETVEIVESLPDEFE